jgi:hypothetical protein
MYVLTDGSKWFRLECSTPGTARDDGWRSIAKTIEFLPQS